MHIALLTWWTGSEREVSLRSVKAVEHALGKLWYSYTIFDYPRDIDRFLSKHATIDFVFLMIHGNDGEDGKLAGLLDSLNIRYQCTSREVLAITINKYLTKLVWKDHNIPVANDKLVDLQYQTPVYKWPCVIKALHEWSSVGVWICSHSEVFDQSIIEAKQYWVVLIEEFLEWPEYTTSILEINGVATTLPLIEIIPPEGKAFDYENKYNNQTQEICPANLDPETTKHIQDIALQAYHAVWCTKYARIDVILTTTGPRYLEINTIPWFTDASLFPKAAKAHGIEFEQLVQILIDNSL